MKCTNREVSLVALGLGLFSTCALALAVATDFWLYTSEPVPGEERFEIDPATNESIQMPPMYVSVHSGLWRVCVVIDYWPGRSVTVIFGLLVHYWILGILGQLVHYCYTSSVRYCETWLVDSLLCYLVGKSVTAVGLYAGYVVTVLGLI